MWGALHDANVSVLGLTVEHSARAGVVSFGGSVSLASSTLECNAIHLASQDFEGRQSSFEDRGENRCGCAGVPAECVAVTAGLEPPEPLGL